MSAALGIFYVDDGSVSGTPGSDSVRATLAAVVFSNPASSTVRGTKVAHGLVTGALVTVSGCTQAYANDVWKITKITNDTFDLDTAVWASFTGADVTGDVVPFGGSSWADAFATIKSGLTAGRLVATRSIVRCAMSQVPVSVGSAAWSKAPVPQTTDDAAKSIVSSTNATPIVVTVTGHPFVNGDFVRIQDHTTNTSANGIWKVANKTADTFELEGSVGVGVGGATGDATKRNHAVVYLAAAQTTTVDNCDLAWTLANGSTVARVLSADSGKQGAYHLSVTKATYATSTLYAYKAVSPGTLAAYQKLTFMVKGVQGVNQWKVCLCSDAVGAVIVDTFVVPASGGEAYWQPVVVTKTGGGNLGASIASIAIYSHTSAPTNATEILFDNFEACTTTGLNLTSLISKNSAQKAGTEGWYGIQSILGRIVVIDNDESKDVGDGTGYAGSSATVTTYKRDPIKTTIATGLNDPCVTINASGTEGSNIEFRGGWDTTVALTGNEATDTAACELGETIYDGGTGRGWGLNASSKSFVTITRFIMVRYSLGCYFDSCNDFRVIEMSFSNLDSGMYLNICSHFSVESILNVNNSDVGLQLYDSHNNRFDSIGRCQGNGIGITLGGYNVVEGRCCDNVFSSIASLGGLCLIGVVFSGDNNFINSMPEMGYNSLYSIVNNGKNHIKDAVVTSYGTAGVVTSFTRRGCRLYSQNHNLGGYHKQVTDGGEVNSLATTRTGGTGQMWELLFTDATRTSYYPLDMAIAQIAVVANKLVTVKAWMKKTHATNFVGKLKCRGGQLAGVAADVVATKASDTSWEELTITFTPTESGVVEIEAIGEYVAATGSIYVEDMTITQAA